MIGRSEKGLDGGIRSDQISRSVVSDSLQPHELQHTRPMGQRKKSQRKLENILV